MNKTNKPLTYLACPYSHPIRAVRVLRFEAANRYAAKLMSQGRLVFSPISHTHPIAEAGSLPLGWDFWERYDRAFLGMSCEVVVLCLDGWEESKGAMAEIAIAKELGLRIHYISQEVVECLNTSLKRKLRRLRQLGLPG